MSRYRLAAATALLAALAVPGCGANKDKPRAAAPTGRAVPDEVAAERAKLDPADRALVESQEWCVANTGERLGSMGPPVKLDVKGRPVFVCCKGCGRKAEAGPDKTRAQADELAAKARAEREAGK